MNYSVFSPQSSMHNESMKCPQCGSDSLNKNGRRRDKQNYICKRCGRQFLEFYDHKGYSNDIKKICLIMHKNGMKFREIERATGVNHNTVIHWHKRNRGSENTMNDTQDIVDACNFGSLGNAKINTNFNLSQSFVCRVKNLAFLGTIYSVVESLSERYVFNLEKNNHTWGMQH